MVLKYLISHIKPGDKVIPAQLTSEVNNYLSEFSKMKEVKVSTMEMVQVQYDQKQVTTILNQAFKTRIGSSIKVKDQQNGNRKTIGNKIYINDYADAASVFNRKDITIPESDLNLLHTGMIDKWIQLKTENQM